MHTEQQRSVRWIHTWSWTKTTGFLAIKYISRSHWHPLLDEEYVAHLLEAGSLASTTEINVCKNDQNRFSPVKEQLFPVIFNIFFSFI